MRLHSLLGRAGLPVVLVALATTGIGLPAYADPDPDPVPSAEPIGSPELLVDLPDRVVAVEGKSKTIEFTVANLGEKTAEDVVVTFKSPASAGLSLPSSCTADECKIGDVKSFGSATLKFTVSPAAGLPPLGETVRISAHDSTGTATDETGVTVITAKSGIDLELDKLDDLKLAPGKSATVPIVIHNSGNKAADGVGVVLAGMPYIDFPAKYTNCEAVADLYGVVCTFDKTTIEPGQMVTLADTTPLTVKVAADAPGPSVYFAGAFALALNDIDDWNDLGDDESSAKRADATELKLEPVMRAQAVNENELNEWDNARTFFITVPKNPADSVAIGGSFAGAIGDSRTVKVGYRNDGPADTMGPLEGWVTTVDVKLPKGVEVTDTDANCIRTGDREYVCVSVDNLGKGEKAVFSFTATIKDDSGPGSVTVDGGEQDPKASNDSAKLTVKPATGGAGGGLPVTGAPAGLIMGGGAVLLLAGAIALWTARRRRILTVVD
ncbi:DUF11 domain-containing protein [Actinoplanes sp. N902-109]|uniref:DUF11 domain-containing protein n=1 Tax=Actinoplanes sp. (strain N902-109) TaxID=649831 RepID=UPI0012F93DCB|nr:DUF11 domain-containing protein [Actinoplanes sp. N902-109]